MPMQCIRDFSFVRGLRGRVCLSVRTPVKWRAAAGAALAASLMFSPLIANAQSASGPVAEVNPMIGTGTGPGDSENLFPGPSMPFGMVQLSPDTESSGFGYHYYQHKILGFSMTHMSGVGCSNEGEVFFTPTTGPVDLEGDASNYSHQQESASPGYYQVQLLRWGIEAALTATDRTGEVKLTFPAGKQANLLIPISHTLNNAIGAQIKIAGNNRVEGYVTNETFCGSNRPYKVYFVMEFSHPFAKYGTWSGYRDGAPAALTAGSREATQPGNDKQVGAYVSWPQSSDAQTVTAKIGISYVDLKGAEGNLKAEAAGKSFAQIRQEETAAWNRALGVIDVTGGTAKQRTVFYTALYHSLLIPSIFNDADGRYLGFDGQIHHVASGHNIYDNYSGWDIYRSEMPLVALIEPKRMEDIAQSVVLMYQQGGWIGRWPQINQYTNIMAGSPLTVVLATAWLDGLHGFDMKAGWEGMYKDAMQAPPPGSSYQGEVGMKWINTLHYVPNDKVGYGSVSQLQEDAIAWASLYDLAKDLGKQDAAHTLYERALYYRNAFDPQDKMFHPRNADGQWIKNFDPKKSDGFIEGSGWHYQWFAPADLAWVVQAMGRDTFNQRLTQFFDYKKPGWYPQYYNPYNETDLEAPFEFNFSGEPWMTQKVVRRVLNENYPDTPDGVPGNDDAGEMSSWAVMSMMGFYSVDPASRAYELVSPVFQKTVIHLHAPYKGKEFTIEAGPEPESNAYIQSVKVDGKAHAKNWIDFGDISRGGTMQFTLGSSPNQQWGAAAGDAPPSLSEQQQ
ncbi:MAG TPA: glycoside hydrolase family 92 protein [Acidobacterium sp.]|nr:glycoside hydrolase family 92 protein [Acidobacterium sp.]